MQQVNIFLFLGSRRGYAALHKFIALRAPICGILCLVEDAHEEAFYPKVEALAALHQIPIFFSNQVKSSQYHDVVASCMPDLAFAIGWRFLINKQTYQLPRLGTLVMHDSLLPKYRGFAPMNWALINGEKETGVTLFFMVEAVDAGPIVDQLKTAISAEDTADSLDKKIIVLYEILIEKNLMRLTNGDYQALPQNEAEASFTCKRVPEDGLIDWHCSALQIHNLIRATSTPFPGAFTYLRGKQVIIWQSQLPEMSIHYIGVVPGRILGKKQDMIEVLTGQGVLLIEQLQVVGEERVSAKNFAISVKDTFGR